MSELKIFITHLSNQELHIMRHLKNHMTLTAAEAMREYGIMRLASRVHDLRKKGYKIVSERTWSINRYGERVYYVKYSLDN